MAKTLDEIDILSSNNGRWEVFHIKELDENGVICRRVLRPNADVSGEVQAIQDAAELYWTDEMKAVHAAAVKEEEAEITADKPPFPD